MERKWILFAGRTFTWRMVEFHWEKEVLWYLVVVPRRYAKIHQIPIYRLEVAVGPNSQGTGSLYSTCKSYRKNLCGRVCIGCCWVHSHIYILCTQQVSGWYVRWRLSNRLPLAWRVCFGKPVLIFDKRLQGAILFANRREHARPGAIYMDTLGLAFLPFPKHPCYKSQVACITYEVE